MATPRAHTLLSLLTLLPLLALAQEDPNDPDAGREGDVNVDPNEAGASGHDTGAFSLSKGGLIAIICVVTIVVGGGIIITSLWFIAKKRRWEVRNSLKRVSRRLTGRMDDSRSKRQTRRTGVRMASPPAGRRERQERRNVDIEKVAGADKSKTKTSKTPEGTNTQITSQFDVETPKTKTWKEKMMGSR